MAKEKPNKVVFLAKNPTSGLHCHSLGGAGDAPARSQVGDIPIPMQSTVAMTPSLPLVARRTLLLLSSLWLTATNPPQSKPVTAAGFPEQSAESSVEGSTQLLLSVQAVHPSELQHGWIPALQPGF